MKVFEYFPVKKRALGATYVTKMQRKKSSEVLIFFLKLKSKLFPWKYYLFDVLNIKLKLFRLNLNKSESHYKLNRWTEFPKFQPGQKNNRLGFVASNKMLRYILQIFPTIFIDFLLQALRSESKLAKIIYLYSLITGLWYKL